LGLCLFAAACAAGNPHVTVEGTVRSLTDETFIVGATVTLSYRTGTFDVNNIVTSTDAGGHYSIVTGEIPCDGLNLSVSATGFKSFTSDVDCTSDPQQLDFSLAPQT
jgi:hypothetical protein